MKLTVTVGTDLIFELYSYNIYDPYRIRTERRWSLKQMTADPHTESLVLNLIDASPSTITDHIVAESIAYNSFAETLDISWTLYSGLLNTTLSARGQETGVPSSHFSFPRLRLEERLRAVIGLMNSTDDYFPQKEEAKSTHP
jgi:hypothetical protein